jgi:predicted permease
VQIGGRAHEIIGVAPAVFGGLQEGPVPIAGWLPLSTVLALSPANPQSNPRDRAQLAVVGRLRPGQPLAAAAAELAAIGSALDAEAPIHGFATPDGSRPVVRRQWSARAFPALNDDGPATRMGALLLVIVGLVLVVACTNLGNLTLSRGVYRRHELAVRGALGASRRRLVRELLAETIVIAAAAAVCTTFLTQALVAVASFEIPTPLGIFMIEPALNLPAVAVASAALLLSMIVFGLEPALALTRRGMQLSLSEGTATPDPTRGRRQRAFIRWQVAISACFFLIASVLVKVFAAEAMHDSGIAVDRLAITSIHVTPQSASDVRVRSSVEEAAALARQNSTFTSVAVSSGMPFGLSWTPWAAMTLPGDPPKSRAQRDMTGMIAASPEIFRTLGIPIVLGRQFDDRDIASAAHVIVLSEQTATKLFGTVNAIGRQVTLEEWGRFPAITFTVVGVARETDSGRLMSRGDDVVYVPLADTRSPNFLLIGRTTSDPAGAARHLQTVVRSVDPDLGTGMTGPAFWLVAGPYVAVRIGSAMAAGLGALTLLLAMIGLYGVQSQAVVYRTREMGVRMALGAEAVQIARMVLGQGFRPVVEGMVLGLFFGTFARFAVRAIFVAPIQIVDPVSLVLVPLPLGVAALLACYFPARRAARVDPNVALRHL